MLRRILMLLLCAAPVSAQDLVERASGGGTVDYLGARNTHAFHVSTTFDAVTGQTVTSGEAEFQLRYRDTTIHASLDCLTVEGTTAWVSGTITSSSDDTLVGAALSFAVIDNGEGRRRQRIGRIGDVARIADQTSEVLIGAEATICTSRVQTATIAWTNGNVQVEQSRGVVAP